MTQPVEPSPPDTSRPLPPVYSRLSAARAWVADGPPAEPYFGPAGRAGRVQARGAASGDAGAADARGDRAAPDSAASHRGAAGATPPLVDRTAARAVTLLPQPDDAGAAPWPLAGTGAADAATHLAGPVPVGQAAAPAPRLAEQVAERLERLALRLRTHGDPRLAVALEAGDELETIIARVVGDHLREHGA